MYEFDVITRKLNHLRKRENGYTSTFC